MGRRRNQKLKTPDSGYEPSFGTGTRMRGYGNVGSNDLHIYLGWPAHLLSSYRNPDPLIRSTRIIIHSRSRSIIGTLDYYPLSMMVLEGREPNDA